MRNSKILLTAAIVVVVLILVIFAVVFLAFGPGLSGGQTEGMFVHDFDSQIADMKIVNGEKEYFAVKVQRGKYDSYYNIYDRQLNPVLKTELSFAGTKVGRWLPLGNHKDQWWLLDVETLELKETDLIEPVIHESGEYVAGQRKVKGETSWVVERIKNGEVLWEGAQRIVLPSQQWYAIAKAGEENAAADDADSGAAERDQIINLRTGEVEYTAKEFENIVEGGLGYWRIKYDRIWDYLGREEYFYCEYLLHENYEMAFDGQLFGNLSLDGDYIYGHIREDQFIRDFDTLKFEMMYGYTIRYFIWTPQGEEVYRTGNMYYDLLGIRGNYAIVQNDRDQYELWIISEAEGSIERKIKAEKNFFYLDAEDGFMRAVKNVGSRFYQIDLKNVPEDSRQSTSYRAEDYRWSFLDRDLEPVLPFDYTYASETENGFAVVKNREGQLAIIDLKMVQ